jgi:hypothetical protein
MMATDRRIEVQWQHTTERQYRMEAEMSYGNMQNKNGSTGHTLTSYYYSTLRLLTSCHTTITSMHRGLFNVTKKISTTK